MYTNLVSELVWNPAKVNKRDFLKDYALSRHGKISAKSLIKSVAKLAEGMKNMFPGVLNQRDFPWFQASIPSGQALYRRLPCLVAEEDSYLHIRLHKTSNSIPHLREALRLALLEKKNKLYENDLVDVCRSCLGQIADFYITKLYFAFLKGNRETFEQSAKYACDCLDWLEKLLSTREDFSIENTIKEVLKSKRAEPFGFTAKSIIQHIEGVVCKGEECPGCGGDYVANDVFEEFRYLYKPQLELLISRLRQNLDKPSLIALGTDGFRKLCQEIDHIRCINWNQRMLTQIHVADRFKGNLIQAVQAAFKAMQEWVSEL